MAQPSSNSGTNGSGATLPGLFKQVYSKEVRTAIPAFSILQAKIPFSKAQLLGDKYHLPVVLSDEHGFTYGGNSAANYTLNSGIAMQLQDAQIASSELTLQSGISYGAVSRAQNKGEQAIESSVRLLIERMKSSASKRVEIELLYGASLSGLSVISATSGSSTTRVYTLLASTYANGIWAGMENAQLDAWYNTGTTGVQLNTNAPVVITAVSVGNKTVSVSGNAADLTAIDAQVGSVVGTSATFFFYGAFGNEMSGLDVILTNTGSLFNISATTYNLWQANVYDCLSAQLTMGKVLAGLAIAVGRGLMEDVALFLAPDSFANLVADLSAQRRYDGSYKSKKGENGFETLEFVGQNGMIELIPHAMMKSGDAFAIPLDLVKRVGSTDVNFRGEMVGGEMEYLFQNTSTNGWTCRAYTDQAIFIEVPAQCVKFKNITPTT
ncbi:MAG: hypothetical protein NVS3B3_06760 [Aquirhabdus sp.]